MPSFSRLVQCLISLPFCQTMRKGCWLLPVPPPAPLDGIGWCTHEVITPCSLALSYALLDLVTRERSQGFEKLVSRDLLSLCDLDGYSTGMSKDFGSPRSSLNRLTRPAQSN